jgi:hypothetical protein
MLEVQWIGQEKYKNIVSNSVNVLNQIYIAI